MNSLPQHRHYHLVTIRAVECLWKLLDNRKQKCPSHIKACYRVAQHWTAKHAGHIGDFKRNLVMPKLYEPNKLSATFKLSCKLMQHYAKQRQHKQLGPPFVLMGTVFLPRGGRSSGG